MSSVRLCTAVTISPWRNRKRMMSAALLLSLGPTSLAVEPRSMMISPSGTGALLGCHVVICVGSSSSTLRRRRLVTLRWDPRGPPPPRAGPPLRLAPAGAPPVGAPGRVAEKPPPGREGPPVRGAPVLGRALMGRGPLEGAPRFAPVGMGRRAPGGGGIGRPVELKGRPGGGGIGRPDALSGGRLEPSPPAGPPRGVGRMVVGPSGETLRVGAGFTGIARERTTLGALTSTTGSGTSDASGATLAAGAVGAATRVTRVGSTGAAARTGSGAAPVVALEVAFVALVALVAFVAFSAGSAGT